MIGSAPYRAIGIGSAVCVLYVLAFIPVYHELSRAAIGLAIIPILVLGNRFGMLAGAVAGLLSIPVNSALFLVLWEPSLGPFIGAKFWVSHAVFILVGLVTGYMRDLRKHLEKELSERKRAEEELKSTIKELKKTLNEVTTLRGLLPICAACKKIRNDEGYWQQIETYIQEHSEAQFSHGICPECSKEIYPELYHSEL